MNSKMIKCKTCQADISANAKICPQCGAKNKKTIFKKWWFWAIIVLAIIIFVAMGDEEAMEDSGGQLSSSTISSSSDTDSSEANNLTHTESYEWIAENDTPSFTISEKAIAFMNSHANFFPGNSEIKGAISDFVDEEITYSHLSKNISKYGDKLIGVTGYVIDITEAEDSSFTYLHIMDYDGNSYTLYYLGVLDDIFKESEVYAYALPFDIVTFENMDAEYTQAVVGAACYVEAY